MTGPHAAAPPPHAARRTVATLRRTATDRLARAGIDSAALDATLLLARACGLDADAIRLEPDRPISDAAAASFEAFLVRREAREPVSRILGRRAFWTLDLTLSADTLDPRPDSETLVEAVLEATGDRAAARRILDLGCGSGALLLALLSELPGAFGVGVDIAPGAASVAARNAALHGLADRSAFVAGDWSACLRGPFDVVLSNPPYLTPAEIAAATPEVRDHDPRKALDGGADGLDAYRRIVADLRRIVAPAESPEGTLVAFETGPTQADAVAALLAAAGARDLAVCRDLAGRPRCVTGRIGNPAGTASNPGNP